MSELIAREGNVPAAPQTSSLFQLAPRAMIDRATVIAEVLADIIRKQGLYVEVKGNKHVKAEGWATLGTLLGILPKERNVIEHDNGDYEAYVDLVRQSDSVVVGGASAICGRDEKRWADADRYARRSMAITRATGKAYRLSFAWILTLAGYSPTPAEEMPYEDAPPAFVPDGRTRVRVTRKSAAPAEVTIDAKPVGEAFDPTKPDHCDKLKDALVRRGIADEDEQDRIAVSMKGRLVADLDKVIAENKLPF